MSLVVETISKAKQAARRNASSMLEELALLLQQPVRDVLDWASGQFSISALGSSELNSMLPAFDLLPLAVAMQRDVVLLRDDNDQLLGVLTDPTDGDLCNWLVTLGRGEIALRLALRADLQAYLAKQESAVRTMDSLTSSAENPDKTRVPSQEDLSFAAAMSDGSPAVRLISSTLYDALKEGASDIHIECLPAGLAVRYRIDGVVTTAKVLTGRDLAQQAISRLKVLAELDIAEQRVPQDGSFTVNTRGSVIDMRLSIMPSIHGEDAVVRILDKRTMVAEHGALTLDALGFDVTTLGTLRKLAQLPYGMLLVTGPTGSGKTTTLYGALSEINTGRDKIITIEDPVEYQVPGILQIPVNDKKGLSFARGLRSILRHDPDKIMIGEIRDEETAAIAIQSAQTGHLVLTTVHANNVFEVFGRFTHMGIDLYALVHALTGVVAQRLIRINCPQCSAPRPATPEELELLGGGTTSASLQLFAGSGCGDCRGTGFKGRKAIAECLVMSPELREMIVARQPIRQIQQAAERAGTLTLRNGALALVARGETTLEEANRVTLHV